MATRSLTNNSGSLRNPPSGVLREEDYRTFCAALESTQRGRDFLAEYGRRNRNADTEILLDSLDRIEGMMRTEGAARDRLQDELRVLLIAIRLARPDINSATALTKAARLVDLLDMMERRIDAMVENKDLLPITEEPLPAPTALSVVPRPDEPELPIPSFASMQPPPPIALVQEVTVQELPQQELPKPETPKQIALQQAIATPEPAVQEAAIQETAIQALAKQETKRQETKAREAAIEEAAIQEWVLKAPRTLPAQPYPLFGEEMAAPSKTPEEKWLPDFGGDEAQIIHTQPVRAMALMPEVAFAGAPAASKTEPTTTGSPIAKVGELLRALARREPSEGTAIVGETALVAPPAPTPLTVETDVVVETEVVVEAAVVIETEVVVEDMIVAPPAEPVRDQVLGQLRDHPLAAIMSLSEEERIALFT